MTIVRLLGFKEKYQAQCPKRLQTIAAFIVEEFLEYFVRPTPPVIVLRTALPGKPFYSTVFSKTKWPRKLPRRTSRSEAGRLFEILQVRLYSTHINEHRLYLCAHGRAVVSEKLAGRIPNLVRHLQDDKQEEFIYAAYVNSSNSRRCSER